MPVGFDNTFLSILLNPHSRVPNDPATGAPISDAKLRAEHLVSTLSRQKERIIIPTPAIAELLTVIGHDAKQYLNVINGKRLIEEAPFDTRCAIELAILNRTIFRADDARNHLETRQKIKVDRQILAILKVANVDRVYTDDHGLASRAKLCGIIPIRTHELVLPPTDRQLKLQLDPGDEIPESEEEP